MHFVTYGKKRKKIAFSLFLLNLSHIYWLTYILWYWAIQGSKASSQAQGNIRNPSHGIHSLRGAHCLRIGGHEQILVFDHVLHFSEHPSGKITFRMCYVSISWFQAVTDYQLLKEKFNFFTQSAYAYSNVFRLFSSAFFPLTFWKHLVHYGPGGEYPPLEKIPWLGFLKLLLQPSCCCCKRKNTFWFAAGSRHRKHGPQKDHLDWVFTSRLKG